MTASRAATGSGRPSEESGRPRVGALRMRSPPLRPDVTGVRYVDGEQKLRFFFDEAFDFLCLIYGGISTYYIGRAPFGDQTGQRSRDGRMHDGGQSSHPALVAFVVRAVVLVNAVVARPGHPTVTGTRASHAATNGPSVEVEDAVVTISGAVTDSRGGALPGIAIQVSGSGQALSVTGPNGSYVVGASNCDVRAGSWDVLPRSAGCTFVPPVAHLTHLENPTVVNFTAHGEACAGRVLPIDPGPRAGSPGAGGPPRHGAGRWAEDRAAGACIRGLAAPMRLLCEQAFARFQEVDSVSGTIPGEEGVGLGPTFNGNSCAMCHAQPAILGSSPAPFSPQRPSPNPQVALATLDGAHNDVPSFIMANGPIRAVRFRDDGEVYDLFSIAGRKDAAGCAQEQPNFAAEAAAQNLSFRIPLALFGLGLVETVSDATLRANLETSRSTALGIHGTLNRLSDGGTIGRFGWKAQNRSLLLCSAEAYAIEIGVTNDLFPEERHVASGCTLHGSPEDANDPARTGSLSETSTDIENFAFAIRLSAPPEPSVPDGIAPESVAAGHVEFMKIGCGNCHTPRLETSTSSVDARLSRVVIHPFSDFALHHMGAGLTDGITQERAGPDEFRTSPLWGVGQRLFFLHDGRTSDLVAAIEAHASDGSEANVAIENFNQMPFREEQDILNFLRSL